VGPSAIPFSESYATPDELTVDQIKTLQNAFAVAAERAFAAGFRVIEIHGARRYLVREFLSPFSNRRADAYAGSFDNRTRFLRYCVAAARRVLPERCPLFVRSQRPTGSTAAGTSTNPSSLRAGCSISASI
jgi:2,4-dienoyl-CoA reductase-like NADH-dependent reductase (Old Yellow Enzyme family)